MSATNAQVTRLRNMTDEPTEATYTDDDLKEKIEAHPIPDVLGTGPYWYQAGTPPVPQLNQNWIPTYDLSLTAGEIWEEKAAAVAEDFDFNADRGSYTRSQVYEQYKKEARYYGARRAAGSRNITPVKRVGSVSPADLAAEEV